MSPIGLDVGARGARAAQVERGDRGYRVARVAVSERLGAEAAQPGDQRSLGRRIRDCVSGRGFRGRRVAACASPDDCEFHLVELPAAVLHRPATEAAQAVRFEVARLFNEPIDEMELRHWPLTPCRGPGPGALAVTARRKMVVGWVSACQDAGLTCVTVDTHATALSRLGAVLLPGRERTVWGVLDLGNGQSRLVMCAEGAPVLVRAVGAGGAQWTEAIAEALQISPKAAEVQKRERGIAAPRIARGTAVGGPGEDIARMLFDALRRDLNELAAEVKRSYEYVLGLHPDREAGPLVLVGGGALTPGLPEFLSSALGIEARTASQCAAHSAGHLEGEFSDHARLETLALAVGLGIEG